MNDVKLSGHLTADPELKMTPSNVPVCTFVLAVDRSSKNKTADFPTIVAWRKLAEFVVRYLRKGRKIIVEGELRTRIYEDPQTKKKHKVSEVKALRIEFADSKQSDAEIVEPAPLLPDGFEEIADDDELPM